MALKSRGTETARPQQLACRGCPCSGWGCNRIPTYAMGCPARARGSSRAFAAARNMDQAEETTYQAPSAQCLSSTCVLTLRPRYVREWQQIRFQEKMASQAAPSAMICKPTASSLCSAVGNRLPWPRECAEGRARATAHSLLRGEARLHCSLPSDRLMEHGLFVLGELVLRDEDSPAIRLDDAPGNGESFAAVLA